MTCPFCGLGGDRRALHGHMLAEHRDRLVTRSEAGRTFLEVNCPACPEGISKEVNPRGRDPEFVEKFADEIGMVGFDLLLYHWETHDLAVVQGAEED